MFRKDPSKKGLIIRPWQKDRESNNIEKREGNNKSALKGIGGVHAA
jgi:hypothetical protein